MAENVTDPQVSRGGDEEPPPSGKEMPHTAPTSLSSTSEDPPPPSGKEMPHTTPQAEES
jgi:hypothetical protein